MTRESKRAWIAAKRHNQPFNAYTNKVIDELRQKLAASNAKVENLEMKLKELKSTLLQQRERTKRLREYKEAADKTIKKFKIPKTTLSFGVDMATETKEQTFSRLRNSYIEQFIEQCTAYYHLTDQEQIELRVALNAVSDNILRDFIKLHKLRSVFYESNEELISTEAFTKTTYTYMLYELKQLGGAA